MTIRGPHALRNPSRRVSVKGTGFKRSLENAWLSQLKGRENYRMPKIREPNPKMERAASIIK